MSPPVKVTTLIVKKRLHGSGGDGGGGIYKEKCGNELPSESKKRPRLNMRTS